MGNWLLLTVGCSWMEIRLKPKSLLSLPIYHHHHYFFTLLSRCFFSALTFFLICTFINLADGEQSALPAESSLYLGPVVSHRKGSPRPAIRSRGALLTPASLSGITGWRVQFWLFSYLTLQMKGTDCPHVHLLIHSRGNCLDSNMYPHNIPFIAWQRSKQLIRHPC